jgi:hypothetical protein
VQTFRKEKRIAKKPKRSLLTRKALKREHNLRHALSSGRVTALVDRLFSDETIQDLIANCGDQSKGKGKGKCKQLKLDEDPAPLALPESKDLSALALMSTVQPSEADNHKDKIKDEGKEKESGKEGGEQATGGTFRRIVSYSQMVLSQGNAIPTIATEEPGPRMGQVSRGVDTPHDLSQQGPFKPIFYVYPEAGVEDEYRGLVDYTNLVPLRVQCASSTLPPFARFLAACPGETVARPPVDLPEYSPSWINVAGYAPQIAAFAFCGYSYSAYG